MTEARSPIRLSKYNVGDLAELEYFEPTSPRATAAQEANALEVGDAAFILRSGHKWTYAILAEKVVEDGDAIMRFNVDSSQNRKTIPKDGWGKYIRVIKKTADEKEMETGGSTSDDDALEKAYADIEAKDVADDEAGETKGGETNEESELAENKEAMLMGLKLFSKDMTTSVSNFVSDIPGMFEKAKESDFVTGLSKKIEDMKKRVETSKSTPDETKPPGLAQSSEETPDDNEKEARDDNEETPPAPADDNKETPAAPAPEPEKEPIKLLRTPISFFRGISMKEDPAVAALNNTSFATEKTFDSDEGIVTCKHDPASAEIAEALAKEREYGHILAQGVKIIESEADLKRQGISTVECL